jgi:hypothetical protein
VKIIKIKPVTENEGIVKCEQRTLSNYRHIIFQRRKITAECVKFKVERKVMHLASHIHVITVLCFLLNKSVI